MLEKIRKILGAIRFETSNLESSLDDAHINVATGDIEGIKMMLEEMKWMFDMALKDLRGWSDRAMVLLGAEVTLLTTIMLRADDSKGEVSFIMSPFLVLENGWFILSVLIILLWIASATLFIVAVIYSSNLASPPDVEKLIDKNLGEENKYRKMSSRALGEELIAEYKECNDKCTKKMRRTRGLVHAGLYALTLSVILSLILKVSV